MKNKTALVVFILSSSLLSRYVAHRFDAVCERGLEAAQKQGVEPAGGGGLSSGQDPAAQAGQNDLMLITGGVRGGDHSVHYRSWLIGGGEDQGYQSGSLCMDSFRSSCTNKFI